MTARTVSGCQGGAQAPKEPRGWRWGWGEAAPREIVSPLLDSRPGGATIRPDRLDLDGSSSEIMELGGILIPGATPADATGAFPYHR